MKFPSPSFLVVFLLAASGAQAQAAADPALDAMQVLDATQILGRRLLNQHCAVCHLKPQLGAVTYGPALNRESLGGQAAVLRQVIGDGTPRMPGFKYEFKPEQIDAIVAYLKSVPVAPTAPARAAPSPNQEQHHDGQNDD